MQYEEFDEQRRKRRGEVVAVRRKETRLYEEESVCLSTLVMIGRWLMGC